MRHQKSLSSRLLALLLCLSLVLQMGGAAWAAEESAVPEEGMLSVQTEEDSSVPEGAEEIETQAAEAPADESEAPAEDKESKVTEEKTEEQSPEKEPDVDSPEFWSEFREEYAEDGDYLKRYELYQEEGVKRAFEDDDDIPGTIEAMSEEELELMAANGGTTKSPFTGKTYTHAAVHKGKTVVLGIDVSKWQSSVDWHKVKAAGVKYVILRCGYTRVHSFNMNKDERFDKFIQDAHDAGLKIGIYYFSQATTVSEAEKEAKKTLEQISPYKSWITLPVFMDIETGKMSGKAYRINKVSRSQGTKNVQAYCKIIKDAGYKAYYYGNPNDLANMCDVAQLGDYGCWLARYATSTTYSGSYDYWQYTSVGKVNGIKGGVDCNFWYTGKGTAESTVTTTVPAQVTGLSVTETGEDYLGLKWNVISNAESYVVEGLTAVGSYETLTTSKGNTCKLTGLTAGTTYTLRVKAVNSKGTGLASAAVTAATKAAAEQEQSAETDLNVQDGETTSDPGTITTDPGQTGTDPSQSGETSGETSEQPPVEEPEEDQTGLGKPETVTVTWTGDNAQIDWTAVDGAKHYRVFYKTSTNGWTVAMDTDELSAVIEDVDENAYLFAVRCVNQSGTYASDEYTSVYRCATPKLTAAENNGSQVKVKWKKVAGAKKYVVFYSFIDNPKWKRVGTTSSTSITQKGSKGAQIRYTVRCITDDEEEYASDFDPNGMIGLGIPKITSVKNSKKGTLDAVWTDGDGADGHEIRFVLSGKEVVKKSLKGWKKTKYSATGLKKGKTYEVSVRTWKKVKGKTFYSSWSGVKKVKVTK